MSLAVLVAALVAFNVLGAGMLICTGLAFLLPKARTAIRRLEVHETLPIHDEAR